MEFTTHHLGGELTMLCSYYTEKLLGLKEVIVKNVTQTEEFVKIEIEVKRRIQDCPCCGAATGAVHDYRRQVIKDISAFGKHTQLILSKRRYRCTSCGKRFQEANSFLPKYHRMTSRLIAYVLDCLRDTCSFTSVAKRINLSVSTVIRIFNLVSYAPLELPHVLSIDEFKGNTNMEKYQCILTDPVNHRIIDILPSREKHRLIRYFKPFSRNHVTHFVSDMWSTYADISHTFFHNAKFIVDKYHFIRQVIWAFEAVRKELQHSFSPSRRKYFKRSRSLLNKRYAYLTDDEKQQVQIMLYTSETLKEAYLLKEQFLEVLDSESVEVAKEKLCHWILCAGSSGIPRFEACAKTMSRWSKGILNALEFGYTNGFTEGCNNKIKVLKRNAYGYRNFNRFRNRILHVFSGQTNAAG
jgi:transposase